MSLGFLRVERFAIVGLNTQGSSAVLLMNTLNR